MFVSKVTNEERSLGAKTGEKDIAENPNIHLHAAFIYERT